MFSRALETFHRIAAQAGGSQRFVELTLMKEIIVSEMKKKRPVVASSRHLQDTNGTSASVE